MVQSKSFIIVVGGFSSIQFYSFLESFQCKIILLILKVTQAQIILGRGIILNQLTSFTQIGNRFPIFLDLSVTISSMEERLEMSISCFYVFDAFGEILNGIVKVHESGMNKPSVKIM